MNTVHLIGRLTADPELRETSAGKSVAAMRVAIPRPKLEGEDRGADYVDVIAFATLGENCAKYLTKGRQIAVSGRLNHSEWEAQDTTRRQRLEIIARDIEFLGAPKSSESNGSGQQADAQPEPVAAGQSPGEDIPF